MHMIICVVATTSPHSPPFSNQIHLTPLPIHLPFNSHMSQPVVSTRILSPSTWISTLLLSSNANPQQSNSEVSSGSPSSSQNSRSRNKPGSKKLLPALWNSWIHRMLHSPVFGNLAKLPISLNTKELLQLPKEQLNRSKELHGVNSAFLSINKPQ